MTLHDLQKHIMSGVRLELSCCAHDNIHHDDIAVSFTQQPQIKRHASANGSALMELFSVMPRMRTD